jgi:hypothetical protein
MGDRPPFTVVALESGHDQSTLDCFRLFSIQVFSGIIQNSHVNAIVRLCTTD